MEINVGDKLIMKKAHPCGNKTFVVLRTGMDLKIKCEGCGHEIMSPRLKIEKRIKQIINSKK